MAVLARHTRRVSLSRQLRGMVVAGGVVCALLAAAWFVYDYWHDHRFDVVITEAATRHGLSPFLVKAVVWQESRFEPDARGKKGEIGLMQVMPSTAGEWAKVNGVAGFEPRTLYDPAANLDIGCWYLRRALDRWANATSRPVPFALAEYNAGRSNALRWATGAKPFDADKFIEAITYGSTKRYVKAIESRCRRYMRRGHL
jgi:soluble lytic murein transglycosylase